MHRRSVVAYVGDDPGVRDRVARAVKTAWGSSDSPAYRAISPELLGDADKEVSTFTDVCGIVTTATALADEAVANRLAETPEAISVIVVAETVAVETMRTILRIDVENVVTPLSEGEPESEPKSGSVTDPLVDRLADVIEPWRIRFGTDDAARLGEVLLDAGTTLMSTRSDEVETKIRWTMENVGEHADVDRIVCYLRDEDAFDPTYSWCRGGCDTEVCSLDDFPDSERLSTFGNVVRPSASFGGADKDGSDPGRTEVVDPPATVHVPLVADWELIGVVVFEVDAHRAWRDEEIDLYRTFGDLVAYTIARNERRLELRRQTERLEQFNAVVSHDLRNPLNVLSGYLELMEGEISPRRYGAMDRAVTRMETLIDNLLMLAKRGEMIGEIEAVAATAIAEDAWGSIRAPEATLTIVDDLGRVEADPNRLRQVFENLFRNAVDHGGPGVSLEIGPRNGHSGIDGVYVSDDGPGIPSDVSDLLFDSGFSTADSSGIGLAIVDRIADAHGWEVDVHNDDGAVFELSFGTEHVTVV